jgi:hypothetical protein
MVGGAGARCAFLDVRAHLARSLPTPASSPHRSAERRRRWEWGVLDSGTAIRSLHFVLIRSRTHTIASGLPSVSRILIHSRSLETHRSSSLLSFLAPFFALASMSRGDASIFLWADVYFPCGRRRCWRWKIVHPFFRSLSYIAFTCFPRSCSPSAHAVLLPLPVQLQGHRRYPRA